MDTAVGNAIKEAYIFTCAGIALGVNFQGMKFTKQELAKCMGRGE